MGYGLKTERVHKHSTDRVLVPTSHLASVCRETTALPRQRKHRVKITLLGMRLCVKIKRSIKQEKDRVCGLSSSG